mmetsp:Transcript_1113/g.2114  ORF Transcript_1113/g.2114 Transcript_1113/m.2114 type:complete len:170 (+) Transcript_1113:144-653(+)
MGGGASRVQALEDQEELQARLARASNNRHHLVLMNLNTGKLASHSANISKINSKLIKATDKLVDQKTKYTKQVTVKSKAVTLKQKEIDDLKHAERLVAECIATLDPLKKQLADLVVDYETGLQEVCSVITVITERKKSTQLVKHPFANFLVLVTFKTNVGGRLGTSDAR